MNMIVANLDSVTNIKKQTQMQIISRENIEEIFRRFQKACPKPKIELDYTNNYTLLVAVILSAQATDVSVNKISPNLFSIADNPQKMIDMGEERLREHIRSIGLYRNKAKNIIAMSGILVNNYASEVPDKMEQLEQLPGVGRKTANVILNTAFSKPTIAVDTHIFRVANRTGMAPGKNVRQVEQALEKCIPETFLAHAHHWLVLHGRYVCKARKPDCRQCIIIDLCLSDDKKITGKK